ncbi:hypothetical protein PHYSODRAFT_520755 [Phytophthora sojae]|uniref:Uncharacterized protein n=1 Tax=Phytophthora sojae (strain P6497) TaxID=1094619 RepID=G5A0J5_PHYSP|nr:hypothetical protein PHYSODRAFT_520755 [Phytophthora sojae]EGZ10531.1 hypothetical protein PHYSODRAFT_520755 [Phytophthora sojae]|eukprot:XP_009533276.1 hypothetical protein PHYSODRAFT_520755 [Phytophthora sojae]
MNGGSNFQNLSSSTAIPKAPQPKDVHEVVAACQILELFASDYFSADLKASITALVALVTGLARSHVWEADDLPLLVYWINVTLEEYRTQISQATLVPGEFKKTFSLENSSLQHILQTVSSRQLQRLRNEITQSSRAPRRGQEQLNNDYAAKQVAPLTKGLEKLIPHQEGTQLCLRYLSVKGCRSTPTVPCFSGRAHFDPESVHPRLKALIKKRFGGLKAKYSSL